MIHKYGLPGLIGLTLVFSMRPALALNPAFMQGLNDGMREEERLEQERAARQRQLQIQDLQIELQRRELQRQQAIRDEERRQAFEKVQEWLRQQEQSKLQEAERQRQAAAEAERKRAQERHYAELDAAHPDWRVIVASDQFKAYAAARPHLTPILQEGTAEQVNSMLADYKALSAAATPSTKPAKQKKLTVM